MQLIKGRGKLNRYLPCNISSSSIIYLYSFNHNILFNMSIIMDLLYWILEMNADLEKMKGDIEELKKGKEATQLSK